MDEPRFYQRPGFYIGSRLVFALILYIYALIGEWRAGELTPTALLIDLVLFSFLMFVWLAFFAQFVLPVQTFEERIRIFLRLLGYLVGLRGPAIFVKNGQAVTRIGESMRSGPGVLWLDSASGAVTHTHSAFKQTFGPGVHFTGWREKVDETVDLHPQVQKIGPLPEDKPFDPPASDTPEDLRLEVQKRRTRVSALTRDGIEVLPNITVIFKIEAEPLRGDTPGSHFGYDRQAVERAVINQAIDPTAGANTLEAKVAWNELPADLAADLWREYLSKFTLSQLFTDNLLLPASPPPPSRPLLGADSSAINSPMLYVGQNFLAQAATGLLRMLGDLFGRWASHLERNDIPPSPAPPYPALIRPSEPGSKTALQLINHMIEERLTRPRTAKLDPNGQRISGWQDSREYNALHERGIQVLHASVSALRFQPQVEEQLVSNWSSTWLQNARAERERIETARSFAALSGQEAATREHAVEIASELRQQQERDADLRQVLRALLMRSRLLLVRSDRIHRRAINELQELEEVMQWVGSDET